MTTTRKKLLTLQHGNFILHQMLYWDCNGEQKQRLYQTLRENARVQNNIYFRLLKGKD
jgi:phosphatidylserine/phosphatidylglycerophosphate/cardiolipin synthase-like enzyme